MRASVRSTFETTSGSSEISSTTLASASADVIDAKPKPRRAGGAERLRERAAERDAGLRHLGLRGAGLDLEREVELRVLGQPFEQPVEHGQAGLDARGALSAQFHANPASARRGHGVSGGYRSPVRRRRWAVRPMCRPETDSDTRATWLGSLHSSLRSHWRPRSR